MIYYLIILGSIGAIVGIDQLIKWWAYENLRGNPPIEFIHFGDTQIMHLSYYENTGAAFSIFSGQQIFLIIITALFIGFGIYLLVTKKIKRPTVLASAVLVIGGGIGNLIDRIFRGGELFNGFVIDYFEVKLFNFAVFNFADCCVIIGAILFLILFIFFDKSEKHKEHKNV